MIRHDSGSGSSSTVSKEDVPHVLSEEEEESVTPECQLGLSLTLAVGDGNSGGYMVSKPQRSAPKILTADEFKSVVSAASPSSSSSSSSSTQNRVNGTAGTKRAADCVSPSNAASQVVGWPPIRSYRMNNMANNGKASLNKTFILTNEKRNAIAAAALEKDNDLRNHEESNRRQRLSLKSLFVKVNMDGVAIGRKVDLSALNCYQTLAQTLDAMFSAPSQNANSYATTRGLKLLDGSSGYSLTYEDKDGDWMLAGDVPWSMFLNTVKRLRIMRSRNTIQ